MTSKVNITVIACESKQISASYAPDSYQEKKTPDRHKTVRALDGTEHILAFSTPDIVSFMAFFSADKRAEYEEAIKLCDRKEVCNFEFLEDEGRFEISGKIISCDKCDEIAGYLVVLFEVEKL